MHKNRKNKYYINNAFLLQCENTHELMQYVDVHHYDILLKTRFANTICNTKLNPTKKRNSKMSIHLDLLHFSSFIKITREKGSVRTSVIKMKRTH